MPININGTTGISGADGSAATPAIQGADTNTGIFFPAADTVAVSTGGSERMRIDTSGNVGIGTSSPVAKFEVQGGARIGTAVGTSYVRVSHDTANGLVDTNVGSLGYAVPSSQIHYWSIGGTERVRIDSSGNVGIGTSSPAARLHVSDGSTGLDNGTIRLGSNPTYYSQIQHIYNNNELRFAVVGGGQFQTFYTGSIERFRVGPAGQWGIAGANYGTAGQVLVSGGDSAAPSWTTISTTPPTTYGAIGTYVVAFGASAVGYNVGSTTAGSNLVYVSNGTFGGFSTLSTTSNASELNGFIVSNRAVTSMGLSGTWQAMTKGGGNPATGYRQLHLWVRIS